MGSIAEPHLVELLGGVRHLSCCTGHDFTGSVRSTIYIDNAELVEHLTWHLASCFGRANERYSQQIVVIAIAISDLEYR